MGYRSDVAYKIKFSNIETMRLFVTEAKTKSEMDLVWTDLGEGLELNEEKLFIKFEAESVKWYDDYPDVKAHNALLDLVREYINEEDTKAKEGFESWENTIEYGYARIGENDDDIHTESSDNGSDLVWVSRQILFDEN